MQSGLSSSVPIGDSWVAALVRAWADLQVVFPRLASVVSVLIPIPEYDETTGFGISHAVGGYLGSSVAEFSFSTIPALTEVAMIVKI